MCVCVCGHCRWPRSREWMTLECELWYCGYADSHLYSYTDSDMFVSSHSLAVSSLLFLLFVLYFGGFRSPRSAMCIYSILIYFRLLPFFVEFLPLRLRYSAVVHTCNWQFFCGRRRLDRLKTLNYVVHCNIRESTLLFSLLLLLRRSVLRLVSGSHFIWFSCFRHISRNLFSRCSCAQCTCICV